ncbi:Bacterial Ig-like domain (DUF1927) (plasmid) [Mycobacterium sp. JS623]|uniref:DUF4255 domain-containing protein n=1 Tax=Mycobacterium sp. JS623 TaxID=212767 RepID=UPI0002A589FC|nr:DUF4255 domain-containing protein [Mycobacterium sp. JS623]AGB26703.1 Bacterial Ig-like domain (DUF1927) [Mycobacterium sp. JS623]
MSTTAALAATTQMLRSVLLDATSTLWAKLGSTPAISAVPPDRITTEDGDQLNVFLYRTSLNSGWRDEGLPVRSANGTRLTQPPLALDLHYVISAHCKTDLHAELLMGSAMEALHGMSVLTAAAITKYYSQATPAGISGDIWTLISGAQLDQQPEQVTVSFENMSIDDISKLWSVLGEKYRPSAAYVITVVLLQPLGPVRAALPVTQPAGLQVDSLLLPQLASVTPERITWGDTKPLNVIGANLLGSGTQVVFGANVTAAPAATSTAISVDVVLPSTARAGLQPLRIRHQAPPSGGGALRTSDQSNPLALFVSPKLGTLTAAADHVEAQLEPSVDPGQRVQLLLYGTANFTVDAAPRTAAAAQVEFDTSAVPAGTYLVQIDVDGAQSALTQPSAGAPFNKPTVVIP